MTDRDLPLRPSDRHPGTAVAVSALSDYLTAPLTATEADRGFVVQNLAKALLGEHHARCAIRRAGDIGVLLRPSFEGVLFDESGTYSEAGYLFDRRESFPPGLRRDGNTVFLDRAVMAEGPRLDGPVLVSFNPHLRNYYHWLVESLLPLDLLLRDGPADARILLPGTVADLRADPWHGFDHRRMMTLLGLDKRPIVEVAAPLCQLEEACWLEPYAVENIPGEAMRRFRDRAADRLGSGLSKRRRIYVKRQWTRRVHNAEDVEAYLLRNGFAECRPEELGEAGQIRWFQEAEIVIAPHGAALANLLFCRPGTNVIELSPATQFRPYFWLIAQRLGLTYGVLPCPTTDGTFGGNLIVDVGKLRLLHRIVDARGGRAG